MKQIVQNMETGTLRLTEVPAPALRAGGVVVRTVASVISIGTERMKLDFGRKSLLGKARERPDQVRKVVDAARREGVVAAYRRARNRLAGLSPMGYSCAGIVEAVAPDVTEFRVGDRVACAGANYASHAERVFAPKNLVVPVPTAVALDAAAFTTLGAIALQGVRQAELRLGESAAVIGLGILGQLTVQILRAAGVQVLAVDVDPARVALAARHGARAVPRSGDVAGEARLLTGGAGVDAAIITAATSSDDPVRLGGDLCRDRGRVVVVGAVPTRPNRNDFYAKELELRLSRSYGPGRYDAGYEEKGHDYPIGYVRWTERRNMAEFVRLLETGAVRLDELVTHRFPFAEAERAYELLGGEEGRRALGVVLEYPGGLQPEPSRIVLARGAPERPGAGADGARGARTGRVRIGLIGAGAFATDTLLPGLRRLDVDLQGIVTASGISARSAGDRHGFRYAATAPEELFADPEIDAVVIATRHGEHAALAAAALRAGKAVFVEKPLALDEDCLDDVLAAAAAGPPLLVGFNRRFAPATAFLRERLEKLAGARVVHVRANAGFIPATSWVHDPEAGGGRIRGEGCHFIDLGLALAGSPPAEVAAVSLGGPDPAAALLDNVQVTIRCQDGSLVSVLYVAKGNSRSGKERVEVFAGGATGIIDDFRRAELWSAAGRRERWKGSQDKGHAAELRAFVEGVRTGVAPVPLQALADSSRATLRAARALVDGAGGEPGA